MLKIEPCGFFLAVIVPPKPSIISLANGKLILPEPLFIFVKLKQLS